MYSYTELCHAFSINKFIYRFHASWTFHWCRTKL